MVESTLQQNSRIRIALIGSNGAIGREIVDYVKKDSRISELLLLCRNPLAEWRVEEFTPKLTILSM